jgi:flagellar motor protein MotB
VVQPHRSLAATVAVVLTVAATGCAVVPKSRLDDSTKVIQSLRAENAQLKDRTLSLKGENDDLAQRAVDDSRKLAVFEEANDRLEKSVQAYIDEREDLNDAFRRFKRQAQASATPPSSAMISRLRSFADSHEGTTFDPSASALSVEADRLFFPGTDRLRPEAGRWVDGLAALLAEPEAKSWPLIVAGHSADAAVRRVSTGEPEGDLSLARAVRVREALARHSGLDPSHVGVAGLGTSRPIVTGPDDRAKSKNARIEIELSPP